MYSSYIRIAYFVVYILVIYRISVFYVDLVNLWFDDKVYLYAQYVYNSE